MRLEWSVFAMNDRDAIFDHIEAENPRAAVMIDECIRAQTERLLQFPQMGRSGRIEETREIVVIDTPYIAAYSVSGDVITIRRILHHARQWPDNITH